MAFNSITFIIFIALFTAAWPLAKKSRLPRYWLITTASFIFYGWWDWRFLILIILSGTVDFLAGIWMDKTENRLRRKVLLGLSIAVNLGTLCIFKYASFLADIVDSTLGTGLKNSIPPFMLILPVGISFYTFQSMSYTIDVYKRHIKPTHSLIHFFAFLSLFPQLVAGPIIRASELLWRMEKTPHTTENQRFSAIRLIIAGYAQKLLIADNLAPFVDKAFANPSGANGTLFWWLVMIAFSIQIYFDFAGYSNIARGLLKFMGWNIKPNFKFPYFACGFREFWNRWHISLSHWFRDYVYIPLGGSRHSIFNQYAALWGTMLASGLWHGASISFLIWGALHASYVTLERITKWPKKVSQALGIVITFAMVTLAWVFFRANDLKNALHILFNMLTPNHTIHAISDFPWGTISLFIVFELYNYYLPLRAMARNHASTMRMIEIILLGLTLAAAILFRGGGHGFIYFQF